jgi:hypothetical protein
VYAKAPFGGPEQVLKYLARYTHRVAISNSRLVSLEGNQATFRDKDYADDQRSKQMTLAAAEFIRRFVQHVLPSGFVKIRHYGLLANRYREANLRVCRALLLVVTAAAPVAAALGDRGAASQPPPCPHCGGAVWQVVARVPRPTVAEVCRLPLPLVPPPDSRSAAVVGAAVRSHLGGARRPRPVRGARGGARSWAARGVSGRGRGVRARQGGRAGLVAGGERRKALLATARGAGYNPRDGAAGRIEGP